jgi:hypothetical protein
MFSRQTLPPPQVMSSAATSVCDSVTGTGNIGSGQSME